MSPKNPTLSSTSFQNPTLSSTEIGKNHTFAVLAWAYPGLWEHPPLANIAALLEPSLDTDTLS